MSQPLTIRQGFTEDRRQAVAEVVYDAFERKMAPLLVDRRRGAALLAAGLQSMETLVASEGGQVLGVAGLKYGHESFMQPHLSDFIHIYGILLGPLRRLAFIAMDSYCPAQHVVLDMLAVSAAARGRGIGTRLLRATFDFARDRGYPWVRLEVVDTNPDAYRLYERLGFHPVKVQQYPVVGPWMGFNSATVMVCGVA